MGLLPNFSPNVSAYDFSVTIPEGEILEVKLFNSDGTAMGSTTSMNVAPSSLSSAGFNEKNVIVSVATSNEWGYNLVMNIPNTNLVSKEDSSNTIPTLAPKDGGYTCTIQTAATCDFTVNHWGYKINTNTTTQTASNYLPIPTTINLNKNSTTTTGDTTSISFGSRINASQAPGTYQSTITFAVTANPDPTPIMQDISASTLASLLPSNGSTATLKDSRDGTKYTIGKLADGNYWTLDNLALDLTNSTTLNNTTASNTNASATTLNYLKGTSTGTTSDQYATAAVGNLTSGNNYSVPLVNAASKDTTQPLAAGRSGTGKIGVYYNYCAASAGSYCYGNGTNEGSPSGNATEDICPKGWRMPTGGASGEYQALYAAYSNNSANFVNALKTPFSGIFYNGSASSSVIGGFWSSTYSNAAYMYTLYVSSYGTPDVLPQNYNNRYNGYPVRCVYIPTMQSMTNAKLAQLMPTDGSTTTLSDSRDNNKYQITNINGTYWMTDNLKIMGTISASESNFTGADFNISAGGDLTAGDTDTAPRAHYNTADTNSATYGTYYNYCAASAGTVCSETKQDATSDICPKGWRLPTQTELTTIKNNNGTNFNLVLAGYYSGGSLDGVSLHGIWWSATAYDTIRQYVLGYFGGSWDVGYSLETYGYPVRCVYDMPTMQNITSVELAELMPNNGDTTILQDKRDNSSYRIVGYNGRYYMDQNLRIIGPISASLSNFTGDDLNIPSTKWTAVYSPAAIYNNDIEYGAYYNYYAASAGTVSYSYREVATSDICPKNWRLPAVNELSPVWQRIVFAGRSLGGSIVTGYDGYLWTNDPVGAKNKEMRYYVMRYKDGRYGSDTANKTDMLSIRCIFYGA